jgi:TolB protein
VSADVSRLRAALFAGLALSAASATADAGPSRLSRTMGAVERANITASLVYVRGQGSHKQVFGIAADGSGERALTSGASDHYPADVTRDGATLAVVGARGETEADHVESLELVDVNAGRSRPTSISASRLRNPTFSPDGARIAFEADGTLDGQPQAFRDVFVTDTLGGRVTRLTHDPRGSFEPAFTSDGGAIVFAASDDDGAELQRVELAGGGPRVRLTRAKGDDFAARPSPDGRRLAFVSARTGSDRVWVRDLAGGEPRLALSHGAAEERDPSWSRDGAKLTFAQRTATGARIIVWDAANGAITALTDGASTDETPTFSPDGQYVAYASGKGGARDVWISRVDGSARARVAKTSGDRFRPLWVAR